MAGEGGPYLGNGAVGFVRSTDEVEGDPMGCTGFIGKRLVVGAIFLAAFVNGTLYVGFRNVGAFGILYGKS